MFMKNDQYIIETAQNVMETEVLDLKFKNIYVFFIMKFYFYY